MRSEEQVRITAQLIDTTSGYHLWAEQYDRKMTDFFSLMDEITRKIVLSLQVELTEGERAHIWHSATDNFEAWGHAVRGYNLFLHNEKDYNVKAREQFERAIKLDPTYSTAWTYLAWTHWHDTWLGFGETPKSQPKRLSNSPIKLKIWIIHRAKYILCLALSICTKNSMRSPSPKEKEASPLVPTILYAMLI